METIQGKFLHFICFSLNFWGYSLLPVKLNAQTFCETAELVPVPAYWVRVMFCRWQSNASLTVARHIQHVEVSITIAFLEKSFKNLDSLVLHLGFGLKHKYTI